MRKKLIWVGPRHSDIEGIRHLFAGEIIFTAGPSGEFPISFSLEHHLKKRINHNDDKNSSTISSFVQNSALKVLEAEKNIEFLWYGSPRGNVHPDILIHSPYLPNQALMPLINNKIKMRLLFSSIVQPIPVSLFAASDCQYTFLKQSFPQYSSFVLQDEYGAGGFQTFLMRSSEEEKWLKALEIPVFLVSGYMADGIHLNSHVVISDSDVVTFPSSIQIVEPGRDGRMLFSGTDFEAIRHLDPSLPNKLEEVSKKIGLSLQRLGYRGVAGIDFLLSKGELFFVEINPRFQASSFLLNHALLSEGLPSVHELHMAALMGKDLVKIPSLDIPLSYAIRHYDAPDTLFHQEMSVIASSPDTWSSTHNNEAIDYKVINEGRLTEAPLEVGAQKGKVIFNRSVLGFSDLHPPQILPSLRAQLKPLPNLLTGAETQDGLARIKFSLFAYGARISNLALRELYTGRQTLTMRDGIAGGIEIIIGKNIHVNVPIKESFSLLSPFLIDYSHIDGFFVICNGQALPIEIVAQPTFMGIKSSQGMPMENIGQLFTDRLSIYPFRGCLYNREQGIGCRFCEVADFGQPQRTKITDIIELIELCQNKDDINMRHILLSGGVPAKQDWDYYLEVVSAIRKITKIPLYQMIIPPSDLSFLDQLHQAGINEIGFNMEIFDPNSAIKILPGKGKISRAKYFEAMDYAVKLWGNDKQQVRSALIVGLEERAHTLAGVKAMAERGVMPILSPFRPVPLTPLAHYSPPELETMVTTWSESEEIVDKHNQVLGPTCIGCQNNTISMPYKEIYRYY